MTFTSPFPIRKNPILKELWICTNTGLVLVYQGLNAKHNLHKDTIGGMISALISYAKAYFNKILYTIETDQFRFSIYYLKSFELFVIGKSSIKIEKKEVYKTMKHFARDFMAFFKLDVLKAKHDGNLSPLMESPKIVDLERAMNWHGIHQGLPEIAISIQ